ncbi:MAG: chorismate mutase [Patescibacteria group bacterium]|mgnify:FL=1
MKNKLEDLRKRIDAIDGSILALLAKRMETVKKIGQLKKKNNIPAFDELRWQKVIKTKKGFVKKIWEIIHKEALKVELACASKKNI